jgi:hypothetical protein
MRLHLVAAVAFLGFASLLVSACSDDAEAECAQDSECGEVVCPNGTRLQDCVEGECLTSDSCDNASGGW